MPGYRTAPDHRGNGKAGSYPLPWGCLAPRLGKPLVSVLSGAGGLVSSDGGRSNQSAPPPRVTLFPWFAGGHGEGGSKSLERVERHHCQPCLIFVPAKLKVRTSHQPPATSHQPPATSRDLNPHPVKVVTPIWPPSPITGHMGGGVPLQLVTPAVTPQPNVKPS